MRSSAKFPSGRVFGLRFFPFREARAVALPLDFSPALEAAIASASFMQRESDDDGVRIAVMCPALGGSFIYGREESERRIRKFYPMLTDDGVMRTVRHLEDSIRIYLNPIKQTDRTHKSWVFGWACTEER